MNHKDKLETVRRDLAKIYQLDHQLYNKLIDITISHCLEEMITKNSLDNEDLAFLKVTGLLVDNNYHAQNIIDLSSLMVHSVREESHNSLKLVKIFLSKSLYNTIIESSNMTSDVVCKILGATLIKTECLHGNSVIGLCKSQFPFVSSKQLVIQGRVE